MNAQKVIELFPELNGRVISVTPLSGGLTNRNFRVDTSEGNYVLRTSDANTTLLGIDRRCEVECVRAAANLGVGPEVVGCLPEKQVMLRRFLPGRVLAMEDFLEPEVIARVASALRRFHTHAPIVGSFSPFAVVRTYHAHCRSLGVALPLLLEEALTILTNIEEELQSGATHCLCHNDLLAANFIDCGDQLRIIDWEYSGAGDLFFDLGNLSVNNRFSEEQDRTLLQLYFGEFSQNALRRLRLMRLASDMREAMWGFLQSAASTLDTDFLAYGHQHLDRFMAGTRSSWIQSGRLSRERASTPKNL